MAQDLYLTKPFKTELVRKLLHLPIGIIPILALYSKTITITTLVVLIIGYLTILVIRKKLNKDILILSSIVRFCHRNVAYDLAPAYMAIGMMVAVIISPPIYVFYAAYVIIVCDSMAAIVGMFLGKHKIGSLPKSLEGSFAFFATCFLGSLYYLSPINALIASLILTSIEIFSLKGLDNLTLPILSQILLIYFF